MESQIILKFLGARKPKPKGPKQDSKNWLWLPTLNASGRMTSD